MSGFEMKKTLSVGNPTSKKFFSVEQANRALVLVRRIVSDIICEYSHMIDFQEIIEAAQCSGKYLQCQEAKDNLVESVQNIQTYAEELEDIGVDLSDWSQGIVGFPSIADGREVVLCWQADEPEIMSWYEVDSNFSERKSINLLPVEETEIPIT